MSFVLALLLATAPAASPVATVSDVRASIVRISLQLSLLDENGAVPQGYPKDAPTTVELGQGTGFVVGERAIVTAGHVCAAAKGGAVLMVGKQKLSIVAMDTPNDLCLTKSETKFDKYFEIANELPEIDGIAFAAGYPAGSPVLIPTSGRFEGTMPTKGKGNVFVIPVGPGSSGSPILDGAGRVVGMVSMMPRDFHHVAISPALEAIRKLVARK